MIDLAVLSRCGSGPVTIGLIGQRQVISKSYLDHLFGKLRRHALVQGTRGPGGGYTLGRDCASISVADIIRAVEAPDAPPLRSRKPSSKGASDDGAATDDLLAGLNARLIGWLESISLKSLVDERLAQMAPGPDVTFAQTPMRRGISTRPVVQPIKLTTPNSVFHFAAAHAE
jgi:Rrf2 family iron-sulfur cluster assembly transcriptional regulator